MSEEINENKIKNIRVKYKLIQNNELALDVMYHGSYEINNEGIISIKYVDEYSNENVVEVDSDNATVRVKSNADMTFRNNTKEDIVYKTPYGDIDLILNVDTVDISGKDTNMSIHVVYDLVQSVDNLHNDLTIVIEPGCSCN